MAIVPDRKYLKMCFVSEFQVQSMTVRGMAGSLLAVKMCD